MKYLPRPSLQPRPPTAATRSEISVAWPDSLLLIEDDPVIARTVRRNLRQNGFNVSHACRATEVVAMEQSFALGVFDIHLPENNGVELARLCLARGIVKQVVFYSAAEPGALRQLAEGLGEFVEKQAGVDVLVERVLSYYQSANPQRRLIAVG